MQDERRPRRRPLLAATVGSATITYVVLASPIACNLPAPPSPDPDATPPDDVSSDASSDAPAPVEYRGNPLCRITADTCNPDDDGTAAGAASTTKPCAIANDAGAVTNPMGCRSNGTAAPVCAAANPANGEGASCKAGAECAPGFDCIAADGGGACRRYCCDDTCRIDLSADGGVAFCDVQTLRSSGGKAPVCVAVRACKLLVQGECAAGETCAPVGPSKSGCVSNGSARAGEACGVEHCSAGLACLGAPGNGRCYEMCRTTDANACGAGQTCKSTTLFEDMTIGVCATP